MTELLLRLLAELARRARGGNDEALETLARILKVPPAEVREILDETPTVGDDKTPA